MESYKLVLSRDIVPLDKPVTGRLYLLHDGLPDMPDNDSLLICDTLEPPFSVSHPCIPVGVYKFSMSESPRFHRVLPRLKNVKGRSGILIHSGNTVRDTKGCILVGYKTHGRDYHIQESRKCLSLVISLIYQYNIDTIVVSDNLPF